MKAVEAMADVDIFARSMMSQMTEDQEVVHAVAFALGSIGGAIEAAVEEGSSAEEILAVVRKLLKYGVNIIVAKMSANELIEMMATAEARSELEFDLEKFVEDEPDAS